MTPFISFPSGAGFGVGRDGDGEDTDAGGGDKGGEGGNVLSPPVCGV